MSMTIWMFSGQGSQYHCMAEDLYRNEPVFRSCMDRADAVARPLIGASVVDEIYRVRDRTVPFRRTLFTHPAILIVEWALAEYLLSLGPRPDLLLGYSLGELTSLVVAGSLGIEEAVRLAIRQALMVEYLVPAGRMLAVLEVPTILEQRADLFAGVELAAVNFRNNFVVTGPVDAIQRTQSGLKSAGVVSIELPVSHPFHSGAMQPIDGPMQHLLSHVPLKQPRFPVASAALGRLSEVAPDHFYRVTRQPLRLGPVLAELDREGPHLYVDLGPSGSMATAVKYNLPPESRSEFLPLVTPFGQERRNVGKYLERIRR